MRRADRLMKLMELLKNSERCKAADLAQQMSVSLRTIYRDVETLAKSGVPIEGTRGVGYRVTAAVTLPPMSLTVAEAEAMHLGLLAVGQGTDKELTAAANSLLAKLEIALPEGSPQPSEGHGLAIYPFADAAKGADHLPKIRQAIRARQKLQMDHRTVRPLKLEYWGRLWICTLWCETSRGFETLRVDQVETVRLLPGLFVDEPGKSLADFEPR